MSYSKNVWNQLKNTSADDLIRALNKDGWIPEETRGAAQAYRKETGGNPAVRRITVHYHPNKPYGPKLLKGLLNDTGWTEPDLKRLKLIK